MSFTPLHSNKSKFTKRRKKLRRNSTVAEKILWQEVRGKKLGYKFRRQFGIGKYIVDFYCYELRLVIEIDGPVHEHQKEYDKRRENWIKSQGNETIRYKNDQILFERETSTQDLLNKCELRKQYLLHTTPPDLP